MIKVRFSGRIGNILLQNIGASVISRKFNIKSIYKFEDKFKDLNLKLHKCDRIIEKVVTQFDSNLEGKSFYGSLIELLNREEIHFGLDYDGTFQIKDFVLDYKDEILSHFNLIYDDQYQNDLFIHVRLGDVTYLNPGFEYYKKCINESKYNRIFLSTDSPNHDLIKKLMSLYPINLYQNDEINTINFGKNFGTLILSKGTFS